MRMSIRGLVVVALMAVTSAAVGAEPSAFRPGELDALVRRAIADGQAKKAAEEARVNNLKLSAAEAGRQAAYYFAQANMYGRIAADSRARAEEIRINQVLSQPYSIRVQPMGYGTYRITPLR